MFVWTMFVWTMDEPNVLEQTLFPLHVNTYVMGVLPL